MTEERNSRQRGSIDSALGFQRYGLLPKEEQTYFAPDTLNDEEVSKDLQDYLEGLSRTGTLSGACKLAGISVNRVYKWRKEYGYDFRDEEEIAKNCLMDKIEEELFSAGLGFQEDIQGSARVRALETALKGNREKYNKQQHEVEGSMDITWLDILNEAEKDEE